MRIAIIGGGVVGLACGWSLATRDADVVILDSVTPEKVGAGRFIFVNTVPPDVPVDILGTMEKPQVNDWDRSHPVMRHVDFSKVAIESAMRIRPLVPGRPLVEAALGGPLVYSIEEPERKIGRAHV